MLLYLVRKTALLIIITGDHNPISVANSVLFWETTSCQQCMRLWKLRVWDLKWSLILRTENGELEIEERRAQGAGRKRSSVVSPEKPEAAKTSDSTGIDLRNLLIDRRSPLSRLVTQRPGMQQRRYFSVHAHCALRIPTFARRAFSSRMPHTATTPCNLQIHVILE